MRSAISFCFAGELGGQRVEPVMRLADRHLGDLADMQAGDLHRERLRLQAIAGAGLARLVGLVALQLLAHPVRFRLAPAPLDIGDDPFERLGGLVVPHAVVIGEGDFVQGAVEHDLAEILRQILPRLASSAACSAWPALPASAGNRARWRTCASMARWHRARGSEDFVRHHQFRLEEQFRAEPVAFRARAIRVVEREQARLDLLDGEARDRAGEFRREDQPFG